MKLNCPSSICAKCHPTIPGNSIFKYLIYLRLKYYLELLIGNTNLVYVQMKKDRTPFNFTCADCLSQNSVSIRETSVTRPNRGPKNPMLRLRQRMSRAREESLTARNESRTQEPVGRGNLRLGVGPVISTFQNNNLKKLISISNKGILQ